MTSQNPLKKTGLVVPLILLLLSGCGESNKAAPYEPPPLDPPGREEVLRPGRWR